MIRKIEFENFMCLKNVSVDLKPLTVFIGPNGSGKSAIFKGLVTLSRLINGAALRGPRGELYIQEPGVMLDNVVWGGNSSLPIRFRVWFPDDGDEPGYTLELGKGKAGWSVIHERIRAGEHWIDVDESHPFVHQTERGGTVQYTPPLRATLRYLVNPFINDSLALPDIEPILQTAEHFGQAWRYRPSAIDIASFVKHPTEPGRKIYAGENGWGLAAELQTLQGTKRETFEAIERAVIKLFPHIKTIGIETDWQGIRLTFKTNRSEDSIPAPQEADGVLLATFLFWRLYTGHPQLKVCLEEPENGLHPFLLADRFNALKEFTDSKQQGHPVIQLLVATHSPEFLRALKAHPSALFREVRLVEFAPMTGSSVQGLTHYREATRLIEKYLENVEETWKPVIQSWSQEELQIEGN